MYGKLLLSTRIAAELAIRKFIQISAISEISLIFNVLPFWPTALPERRVHARMQSIRSDMTQGRNTNGDGHHLNNDCYLDKAGME